MNVGLQDEAPECRPLIETARDVWKPLVPSLDKISLRIMSFYAENPGEEYTLYKVARETGLPFSTVYKKGGILASMRLLEYLGKTFRSNSKTCIALYAHEAIGSRRLYECLQATWNLRGSSELELLSFLTLLALAISIRDLNITNANICFFDEASLHVIRFYKLISLYGFKPKRVICRSLEEDDRPLTPLGMLARIIGLPRNLVIPGIRLALRGVQSLIPPTISTSRHRIWLQVDQEGYKILLVDCSFNCKYYHEDLGLSCHAVHRDVESVLKMYTYSMYPSVSGCS
jgi:hypothetical protein